MNDTTWREHTVTGLAPAGTTQVRVGVRVNDVMTNVDIPFQTANFDDFSLIAVLPGDYNGNGTVDAADYVLWRNNVGTTNPLVNDLIGGTIGAAQYNQWRAHFGQTVGSGSGTSTIAAIPEPSVSILFVAALIGCSIANARQSHKLVRS